MVVERKSCNLLLFSINLVHQQLEKIKNYLSVQNIEPPKSRLNKNIAEELPKARKAESVSIKSMCFRLWISFHFSKVVVSKGAVGTKIGSTECPPV